MAKLTCSECTQPVRVGLPTCPHCGRPSLFPNVLLAGSPPEIDALMARYISEKDKAEKGGRAALVESLEKCLETSIACKALPRWELDRLVNADGAVAATYYQQISGNCRVPDDNRWDRLRRIADAAHFECFGTYIHFAALTTRTRWLSNYGDGALFFRHNMIEHRATVFEDNTARWVDERSGSLDIPAGHRARWADRHLLGVAKLARLVRDESTDVDALLLRPGSTSEDDQFIEVHIYGTFSIRSASAVVVRRSALSELSRASLAERAQELGITVTELT